ncbi:MAG: YARHG domain-containing protein [Alphaproteobacteria bacterium]|nr:YARHG domain-containing protein [Alphaproteobacteria bacterium]
MTPLLALLLVMPSLAGRAPAYTGKPSTPTPKGKAVAKAAEDYLAGRLRRNYSDCSGMVHAAFGVAGVSPNPRMSSAGMWEEAVADGRVHYDRPAIGDVAFFDDTYDKNGDGRLNDPKTHVAVVTGIRDDGTIEMINAGVSKGTAPLLMNLEHRDLYVLGQAHVNDYLASRSYGPKDRPTLSGQLWAGFAHPPTGTSASKKPTLASTTPGTPPKPEVNASLRTEPAPVIEAPPEEPSRRDRRAARRAAREERREAREELDASTSEPSSPWRDAKPSGPLETVLAGEPLSRWDVATADCETLWQLRNSVFARHGYVFNSGKGAEWFGAQDWYTPSRRTAAKHPDEYLTAADHANIALVLDRESAEGCR